MLLLSFTSIKRSMPATAVKAPHSHAHTPRGTSTTSSTSTRHWHLSQFSQLHSHSQPAASLLANPTSIHLSRQQQAPPRPCSPPRPRPCPPPALAPPPPSPHTCNLTGDLLHTCLEACRVTDRVSPHPVEAGNVGSVQLRARSTQQPAAGTPRHVRHSALPGTKAAPTVTTAARPRSPGQHALCVTAQRRQLIQATHIFLLREVAEGGSSTMHADKALSRTTNGFSAAL